jgi:hypothetical protein
MDPHGLHDDDEPHHQKNKKMGTTDSHPNCDCCDNSMTRQFFFRNFKQQMKSNQTFFFEIFEIFFLMIQTYTLNPKNPDPKNPGTSSKP